MTRFNKSNEVSKMRPITMPTVLGATNKIQTGSDEYVTYTWHTIRDRPQPINRSPTYDTSQAAADQ